MAPNAGPTLPWGRPYGTNGLRQPGCRPRGTMAGDEGRHCQPRLPGEAPVHRAEGLHQSWAVSCPPRLAGHGMGPAKADQGAEPQGRGLRGCIIGAGPVREGHGGGACTQVNRGPTLLAYTQVLQEGHAKSLLGHPTAEHEIGSETAARVPCACACAHVYVARTSQEGALAARGSKAINFLVENR